MKETRKHFRQMTETERIKLMKRKSEIFKYCEVSLHRHAIDRMISRNISKRNILKTIKDGAIIEYSLISDNKGNVVDKRIAIRSLEPKRYQTVVVLSLIDKRIITTFLRSLGKTINKDISSNIYDEKLKIFA